VFWVLSRSFLERDLGQGLFAALPDIWKCSNCRRGFGIFTGFRGSFYGNQNIAKTGGSEQGGVACDLVRLSCDIVAVKASIALKSVDKLLDLSTTTCQKFWIIFGADYFIVFCRMGMVHQGRSPLEGGRVLWHPMGSKGRIF
jgi:hypothetical protein